MTDIRIRILHFLKNNAKIIFIVVCIWAIVFFVNLYLKNHNLSEGLQTTYEPHASVMDATSTVPEKVSNTVEQMLDQYVNFLLDGNVQSAYDMLSSECKKYSFDDSLDNFTTYAINKLGTAKRYAIQDYSNDDNTYIYQVKYTDDFLATGITNSVYAYSEEKVVFKKQEDGLISMSVGAFIENEEINNVSENEYIKVDVQSVQKYYSYETYTIKITNRSDYTIVIADGQAQNEIFIQLNSKDTRNVVNVTDFVLKPGSSVIQNFQFQKFYDNDDNTSSVNFGSIRVMEQYSGTENVSDEVIEQEIQNAIAKFSVNVPVK